jgi:opine dehydrogenase
VINKKYAVIGLGNIGQALSSYLLSKRLNVKLYNRSKNRLDKINSNGGLASKGILKGLWKTDALTSDLKEACVGADYIFLTVPANVHSIIAAELKKIVEKYQTIVLSPSRTFGAFEFQKILGRGPTSSPLIVELQTTIHTSRIDEMGIIEILAEKKEVKAAILPKDKLGQVSNELTDLFPMLRFQKNTLHTSLDNIGVILHPLPTLFNIGWIEKENQDFKYYYDAISPTLALLLEKLDAERLMISKSLGVESSSVTEWMAKSYGLEEDSLYNLIQKNKYYSTINAPQTLYHRYIFEDISTGLVPLFSISKILKLECPIIESTIILASHIFEYDFFSKGRNLKNLGLDLLNKKDLINVLKGVN